MDNEHGKLFQVGIHMPVEICKPVASLVATAFGIASESVSIQSSSGGTAFTGVTLPTVIYTSGSLNNNTCGLVLGTGTNLTTGSTYAMQTQLTGYSSSAGSPVYGTYVLKGDVNQYQGIRYQRNFTASANANLSEIGIYGYSGSFKFLLFRTTQTAQSINLGDDVNVSCCMYVNKI